MGLADENGAGEFIRSLGPAEPEPIDAHEWWRAEWEAVTEAFDDRWRAFEEEHGRLLPLVRVWLRSRLVMLASDGVSPVGALDRAFCELAVLVDDGQEG